MPFLTLEDPNARIRGARDPLGVVPIWSQLGRRVVVNLTTASTSTRGFTILLLARYFTELLIEEGRLSRDDALAAFLRTEQMGAYARHRGHGVDGDIRGIERVKAHLAGSGGRVHIGTGREGLILSDQKVYGLWGLFSVPARTSGLIADGPVGLTAASREFTEAEYRPLLEPGLKTLLDLVEKGGAFATQDRSTAFAALAAVLPESFSEAEQAFYGRYLRDALGAKPEDPGQEGRQQRFAELLRRETDLEAGFGRAEAVRLAQLAAEVDDGLAKALEHVVHAEALLAPASALFDHILVQERQHPRDVATRLQNLWGSQVPNLDPAMLEELRFWLRKAARPATVTAIEHCHGALRTGDYEAAIEALLRWNALVTEDRRSAPWARLGDGGRIDVRFRGAEQVLPKGDELAELWSNSYFVNALKRITRQLEEAR